MATKHEPADLKEWLSPFALRMIVDSSQKYRKAYGSYAFGTMSKLQKNWWIFAIVAIVAVVLILWFTGVINFQGV